MNFFGPKQKLPQINLLSTLFFFFFGAGQEFGAGAGRGGGQRSPLHCEFLVVIIFLNYYFL
jgi:hypothetical protein